MICTYSQTFVHDDRYGSTRPLPPTLVVVHTTEGSEGPSSAEGLASLLARPGDRPNSSGGFYGSSYHAIADTFPHVILATAPDRVAFAAPGANTTGDHIVIPGRAGQSREEWLDDVSLSAIRTVAGYIVDRHELYGIPLYRLGAKGLLLGLHGYTDHAAVSEAWKQTTHWDVGPQFPWDVLEDLILELSDPRPPITNPESEYLDMAGVAALYNPTDAVRREFPNAATFALCASGDIRHASGPDVAEGRAAKVREHPIEGPEHYRQLWEASRKGLPWKDAE